MNNNNNKTFWYKNAEFHNIIGFSKKINKTEYLYYEQ